MGVSRLAYLGTTASDLSAWNKYSTEVLGVQIASDSNDRLLYLRADERHHRLTIHAAANDDVAYVGWELANHEAFEAAASVLENNDVRVESGKTDDLAARRVLELAWFTCPYSDVRMELTVGNEVTYYPRFTSPRDLSGFLMGDLGLGHVVLFSPDVRAAAEFYVRTLGFGISDYVYHPQGPAVGAFLHCNPRHHSLAFFSIPMGPHDKKIQHLMVEVNSLDDIGVTYDLCLEQKITKSSLGRHPDDRGLSFYFRNPSRWLFEYAWQLRLIDPANWTTEKYTMGAGNGWGHKGLFSPDE